MKGIRLFPLLRLSSSHLPSPLPFLPLPCPPFLLGCQFNAHVRKQGTLLCVGVCMYAYVYMYEIILGLVAEGGEMCLGLPYYDQYTRS